MDRGRKARLEGLAARMLRAGVSGNVFPGGAACLAYREGGEVVYAEAVGGKLLPDGPAVEHQTLYDLASLTKPFVASAALVAADRGHLDLDEPLDAIFGETRGQPPIDATLFQAFSHRGGFAAWGGLFLDVPHAIGSAAARRWIVAEASRRKESDLEKGQELYSDLGYIVAGAAIARRLGRPLERLVEELVTEPLAISEQVFYGGGTHRDRRSRLSRQAAATERCPWRGRLLKGDVHDENCAALGGVAGHAGLFGSAKAVAVLGMETLDSMAGRSTFLSRELIGRALAPQPGGHHRFGWDGKSQANSSAGKRFSSASIGHLGFTGTSIWCDPHREIVLVLLTNRVHPSRANQKIKGFRPAFHDAMVSGYDQTQPAEEESTTSDAAAEQAG